MRLGGSGDLRALTREEYRGCCYGVYRPVSGLETHWETICVLARTFSLPAAFVCVTIRCLAVPSPCGSGGMYALLVRTLTLSPFFSGSVSSSTSATNRRPPCEIGRSPLEKSVEARPQWRAGCSIEASIETLEGLPSRPKSGGGRKMPFCSSRFTAVNMPFRK